MHDLQVLVPWHPFEKWRERALWFTEHGLQNREGCSVHLVLLIAEGNPEPAEEFGDWLGTFARVSVVRCPSSDPARKIYHFYAWALGGTGGVELDARWFLRVDDDSITDVQAMLKYLDEGFPADATGQAPAVHGGDTLVDVLPDYADILRDMGHDPGDGHWIHEWEASATSHAGLEQILRSVEAMTLLLRVAEIHDGFGDQCLGFACRLAGVPVVRLAMSGYLGAAKGQIAPVERFTRFGGDLPHVHYIGPLFPAYDLYNVLLATPEEGMRQAVAGMNKPKPAPAPEPIAPTAAPEPTPEPTAPALSIIIPVATDALRLAWTLEGLCHQTRQDFEVIVAIDSKPGRNANVPVRHVCDRYENRLRLKRVALRTNSAEFRAAKARNLGVKQSRADVLMFLDADCVPMPGTVAGHLERLGQCGPRTIVQGARRMLPEKIVEEGTMAELQDDKEGTVTVSDWNGLAGLLWDSATPFYGRSHARLEWLLSFCITLRADLFCQVGGFREEYEGWGGEDLALGRDLARAGANVTEFFDEPTHLRTNADVVHLGHEIRQFNVANTSSERLASEAAAEPRSPLPRTQHSQ